MPGLGKFYCICARKLTAVGTRPTAEGIERRYYCTCGRVTKTLETIVKITTIRNMVRNSDRRQQLLKAVEENKDKIYAPK